jgi:hypothetical protein
MALGTSSPFHQAGKEVTPESISFTESNQTCSSSLPTFTTATSSIACHPKSGGQLHRPFPPAQRPPFFRPPAAPGSALPPPSRPAGVLLTGCLPPPGLHRQRLRHLSPSRPPRLAQGSSGTPETTNSGLRVALAQPLGAGRLTPRCSGRLPGVCTTRGLRVRSLRSADCPTIVGAAELIIR